MNANFPASLTAVLKTEGGFVNDPMDGGGMTNKGITQRVYDDWRHACGLPPRSVRNVSTEEVAEIYRMNYWNAVHGDQLPSGVDYATFDFGVNSGVNRACRYLQRAAGVIDDGQIGPVTLAAVKGIPPTHLIDAICDARVAYLKTLSNFGHFGRGWMNRVADVRALAKELAA